MDYYDYISFYTKFHVKSKVLAYAVDIDDDTWLE